MVDIRQTPFAKNLRPRTIKPAGDSHTIGGSVSSDTLPKYAANLLECAVYSAGMRLIGNAGVAGNTAAQLEARFMADVVDQAPDACTILIGTNNFTSGMADSAYTSLFNSLENCVLMALDAGILPIIITPPPKDAAVAESRRAQPYYYRLAEFYGLPLIDLYAVLADPANGQFKSSYSGDGVHLSATALDAAYPVVAAGLSDLPSLIGPDYRAVQSMSAVGDVANLIRNGSFSLGTAPSSITGWTTTTTNTTNTLEDPVAPQTGKVFKAVKTDAATAYLLYGTGVTVVPGNDMLFTGRFKVSEVVATSGGVNIELLSGGSNVRPATGWRRNGEFEFAIPFTVAEGITSMAPNVSTNVAGTYEISNLTLIDLTAMAAIWEPGQQ